ncbi:MAG: phosphoribosyl-AMP cyclohydrolase [bacterium]|nr:phosphoribosyl-AMP cyclohydrolase [bacterium]
MNQTVCVPKFDERNGLVPVVVQDYYTGLVLMLAYTRKVEYLETLATGEAVFYSRSRKKRWKKGEEKSGNILLVHGVSTNCYDDSLLYKVSQTKRDSGACHTGKPTCFYRSVVGEHEVTCVCAVHERI